MSCGLHTSMAAGCAGCNATANHRRKQAEAKTKQDAALISVLTEMVGCLEYIVSGSSTSHKRLAVDKVRAKVISLIKELQ